MVPDPISDNRLAELAADVMGRIGWAFEPLACIPTTELRSMVAELQQRRAAEQQPEAKHDA